MLNEYWEMLSVPLGHAHSTFTSLLPMGSCTIFETNGIYNYIFIERYLGPC